MMERITELESRHTNLELKTTAELLAGINSEDLLVAKAVEGSLSDVEKLIDQFFSNILKGGRLVYVGAGTSGRLGILDASECPPTFGVSPEIIQGIIAGGDRAIRKAVEGAEDSKELAVQDLKSLNFSSQDCVLGIAASGTTPYVLGALEYANNIGALSGCFTCNPGSPVTQLARYPIVVNCGPEFITGSTRMKAGTATKMVLNMISTCIMIKLGHVEGNRMVDMQLSNAKLVDRGTKMVAATLRMDYDSAKAQLLKHGSVRNAIKANT